MLWTCPPSECEGQGLVCGMVWWRTHRQPQHPPHHHNLGPHPPTQPGPDFKFFTLASVQQTTFIEQNYAKLRHFPKPQ